MEKIILFQFLLLITISVISFEAAPSSSSPATPAYAPGIATMRNQAERTSREIYKAELARDKADKGKIEALCSPVPQQIAKWATAIFHGPAIVYQELNASFNIIEVIGKGATAKIYKVHCTIDDKNYAMKLYKPGREQKRLGAEVYFMFKARKTPEGAEYFFDVIAIGTFRQGERTFYGYIMEAGEGDLGPDFNTHFHTTGKQQQLTHFADEGISQVIQGVGRLHIHAQRTHNDIHRYNIMAASKRQLKIADFGSTDRFEFLRAIADICDALKVFHQFEYGKTTFDTVCKNSIQRAEYMNKSTLHAWRDAYYEALKIIQTAAEIEDIDITVYERIAGCFIADGEASLKHRHEALDEAYIAIDENNKAKIAKLKAELDMDA